jgi:hypothetical protein
MLAFRVPLRRDRIGIQVLLSTIMFLVAPKAQAIMQVEVSRHLLFVVILPFPSPVSGRGSIDCLHCTNLLRYQYSRWSFKATLAPILFVHHKDWKSKEHTVPISSSEIPKNFRKVFSFVVFVASRNHLVSNLTLLPPIL